MTLSGMDSQEAGKSAAGSTVTDVACPFCGLLCDDLETRLNAAGGLEVLRNGCLLAKAGFERALPAAAPQVAGKSASLAEAVAAAAELIRSAAQPLFGGMATDAEGVQALLSLAERAGGVVDHALSDAQFRNISVLQSSGWITTTLTEARNRADLLIIAGSDVHRIHPRFFERIAAPARTMFGEAAKRTVVFLGEGLDTAGATGPGIGEVLTLSCPNAGVGNVLSALRARLKDAPVSGPEAAGVPLTDIGRLAELCRRASYGVIAWVPAALDGPNAGLTVFQISETVKELNRTGRFAGLPLGGNEGATAAASVTAWQTGYPLRVNYAGGQPDFDPWRWSIARMLGEKEGDLLLWTASFTPGLAPPPADIPLIALATPGFESPRPPQVFIPVGTPGADHSGRLIRVDSVVSLPLRNLGRSPLPSAASVLAAIEAAL